MMKSSSKLNNIAIVIFGLLSFVCSFVLVWGGGVQNDEFERWQDAPLIQETGELQSIAEQGDVIVVGSIDPETPASSEGLALHDYWQQKTQVSGGSRRQTWEHVYASDHKPAFQLLCSGDRPVTIQSTSAVLLNTREVMVSGSVRHEGFAPGDGVTVFGTTRSSNAPFEVQADIICGGSNEACLESLAKNIVGFYAIAAVLILVGGGLVWVGVRKLRPSTE
jgi:hypothetical protein